MIVFVTHKYCFLGVFLRKILKCMKIRLSNFFFPLAQTESIITDRNFTAESLFEKKEHTHTHIQSDVHMPLGWIRVSLLTPLFLKASLKLIHSTSLYETKAQIDPSTNSFIPYLNKSLKCRGCSQAF